jgi:hypothetical protein
MGGVHLRANALINTGAGKIFGIARIRRHSACRFRSARLSAIVMIAPDSDPNRKRAMQR